MEVFMLHFLLQNKTWIFSGIGIALPIAIVGWIMACRINKSKLNQKKKMSNSKLTTSDISGSDNIIVGKNIGELAASEEESYQIRVDNVSGDGNMIVGGSVKVEEEK